ncbi:MAG: AraC family transcriptional regulator [Eubacteriales bacterium]|jgi:AraC-like DNA-binding protein|nr:AraC family transcriptional regulator [Eubacteriales bacterium]MDD4104423.1 AraC family transcriptional regulator [Eubacteriales bacterium]MDD4709630.1 AraC family transcriptional regulator [Eubacteriales bacterium]NLO16276.1 AraC family transcriptional regulator [Clostridiales bacterium]
MNKREFEFVNHNVITDVQLFFVDIAFRNMHMHKEFELFRVFQGEMDIVCQRESYRLREGDFALLNPRCPHEMHALGDAPVRILPLQVSPSFWARFYPQMSNVEFDVIAIDKCLGDRSERLMRHYISLARTYLEKELYYELRCAAQINILMEILLSRVPWHYLTEKQKETKRANTLRLGRIINYIEVNYTDKLLLKDLCEMEGLSLHYLSRYFATQLGMSFQEYLTMLRYRRARLLLERTNMRLADIAYSSGFSDMRYLNRIFTQMHGCLAQEYRDLFPHGDSVQIDSEQDESAVQRFLDESESRDYLFEWLAAHPDV